MNDPFGSMQGFIGQFRRFINNPAQYMLEHKINIPQQFQNDTQGAIQYLMNSGQLTQDQYNWVNNIAKQIQNNPVFKQIFNK